MLWLDGEAGIALEAHQQNTLVLLDPDGWPVGGRYRDNQGYYFRESRRAELERRLPGIGAHSDTFVSDEVTDERFAYYLGINNVLGLIGAFGSQRLADERVLLAAFRRFLADAATGPAGCAPLPARLLDTPALRCKANLLTRLHGLDELVGPVDTQSVYVTIANPLRPELPAAVHERSVPCHPADARPTHGDVRAPTTSRAPPCRTPTPAPTSTERHARPAPRRRRRARPPRRPADRRRTARRPARPARPHRRLGARRHPGGRLPARPRPPRARSARSSPAG